MRRLRRKNNNAGFSLAETLLAILIMLLVSTIVAAGMPAARSAYEKIIIGANAQTMLSTAVAALRDELGTAWKVEKNTDNPKLLHYFKADTGAYATIYLDAENNNVITVQDFVKDDFIRDAANAKEGKPHKLIADENTNLYATYTSIKVDDSDEFITVEGMRICKQADDTEMASLGKDVSLKIRLLSKNTIDAQE